jgi:hypothetical protein
MPKYVKISKAKNLRFRLISVLYLLFISLSIIQIPIEWLRINPFYSNYMRAVISKDAVSPELKKAREVISQIDSSFVAFAGYDEIKKTIREPAGYSSTDQFFIKLGNAQIVFDALFNLQEYYQKFDPKYPKRVEFERLFKADLANGLGNNKSAIWTEWKFRHVPATVVRTLLAEIKLRLNLLNGAIDLDLKEESSQSVVQLAFNVDLLQLGDTARFVASRKRTTATVKYDNRASNEYYWKGDTLYLVPKLTGKYQVDFLSDDGVESVLVNVEPMNFIEEKGEAIKFFYVGKTAKLKFSKIKSINNVKCDCVNPSQIKLFDGMVEFTPNKAGWCDFEIFNPNGIRMLYDSIYIQDLPVPVVVASNVSAGKISLARLTQQQGLRIMAAHPDMDNFNYVVNSVKVTLVGLELESKSYNGAFISLSSEQLAKLKFIQVNEVVVNANMRDFIIKEPLLIEII